MPELTKNIRRLYFEDKLSARQVAVKLGCSTGAVMDRLNTIGGARSLHEGILLRSTPEYSEKIRITQLGELNTQVKLTEANVLTIRSDYELALNEGAQKTATQYQLASQYGVKRPTISDVVLRKTWTHI